MKKKDIPRWLKLDKAAKVFPATSSKRNTRVFRFCVQLKKIVEESILDEALKETLEEFPHYKSVMKRGLFWYYLETSNILPKVTIENKPICSPIYEKNKKNLLFRVTYYQKRINLEVYHTLADGTGAKEFFRSLIANYLRLEYPEKFKKKKIDLSYNASMDEKIADSFRKYYDKSVLVSSVKEIKGRKFHGKKYSEYRNRVIEAIIKTDDLKDLAHKYETTITILITALFLIAIDDASSELQKRKDIVLSIPVNLRQYFKSLSARNFFGVFNVNYHFSDKKKDLEKVIRQLNHFYKEQLNYEQMCKKINFLANIEKNILIRAVPLFLKDIVLKLIYYLVEKNTTASISNIGKVELPKEFKEYIDYFNVFMSTDKIQMCLCSYHEKLVLSITSPFIKTTVEKNFFKLLQDLNIDVLLSSNMKE